MSKVAIVFWSATGNTETMANCIAEGAGANGTIVSCAEMTPAKLAEFDVVAFGCPAMGAEQLEESEFEPMFAALEGSLNGKKIALFGSYGWGIAAAPLRGQTPDRPRGQGTPPAPAERPPSRTIPGSSRCSPLSATAYAGAAFSMPKGWKAPTRLWYTMENI